MSTPDDAPLTVIIADRSPLVREGLRSVLASTRGVSVLGSAESGAEAMQLLKNAASPILVAGTRLSDCELPDLLGAQKMARLKVRCVVLADSAETSRALRAVEAGAAAVCPTAEAHTLLPQILRGLERGVSAVPEAVLRALVNVSADPLTRREHEILMLLGEGLTNFQISARLGLSENTVKYHLKAVFSKLGVASRAAAAAKYHSGRF